MPTDNPLHHKVKELLTPLEPFCFLGIGGSGMAPLARIVSDAGLEIGGYDQSESTTFNEELHGISVHTNSTDVGQLSRFKTIVRSSAIKDDHPWIVAAKELNLKIMHRSELLAKVTTPFRLITVSGTHGKSTTSAMIAYLLECLGQHPSYVLGAPLLSTKVGSAAMLGSGELMVIESDESDGSFLNYHPQIAVVTNIDADHMEHYGSMERMSESFQKHLSQLSDDGVAVLFWDHERVRSIGIELPLERRCAYGTFLGSDVRMLKFEQNGVQCRFSVVVDKTTADVTLPQIGRHNAINALAALAVIHTLGLPVDLAAHALSQFPGVARRLTLYYQDSKRIIYDDYAHNPVKIASCLTGLRAAFPKSQITAVFQPHRYSRLQHLYHDFTTSFGSVNRVIVAPVYAAGETPLTSVTTTKLADDIRQNSRVDATAAGSLKAAEELLQYNKSEQHMIIVTIGAGDVWTVARNLSAAAR